MQNDKLETVVNLAKQQREYEALVEKKEAELKEAKEKLSKVKEYDLPDLMAELDLNSFELGDGSSVTIHKDMRAYIKEADKPIVFSWLRKNNNGAIIKTEVVAQFGMGEEDKATLLYEELLSVKVKAKKSENVHWKTLNSFVKERLENGEELDGNIQIHYIREAKIS